MKEDRLIIACEQLNFTWLNSEAAEFRDMWREGKSIVQIARRFKRDPDEVLILAIDQLRRGFIKQRPGGALGVMA